MNIVEDIRKKEDFLNLMKVFIPLTWQTRPMIQRIKDYYDWPITMVEVGSDLGNNAKNILKQVPIEKLYLVDPYFDGYADKKGDVRFIYAQNNLKPYQKTIEFIRATSEEATQRFEDESIDAIYIDGNHKYEYVLQDINLWLPKVRTGGFIGGHDFAGHTQGVIQAVTEYVNEHDLWDKLESGGTDWWWQKGEGNCSNCSLQ